MDIILRFEDDHKQVNYKKFVDAVNWREHQIPSFHTIKLPPKVKPLYLSKRKVKTQHVRPLCNLGKCNMSTSSDKDYNGFQLFIFMLVFIFVSSCNIFFFRRFRINQKELHREEKACNTLLPREYHISLTFFWKKKKRDRGKQVYLSLNNGCEYHSTHKYCCHISNDLFGCWDSQEIL